MAEWSKIIRSALVSGSYASLAATAALVLAAKLEDRGALQPINATSHWRYGDNVASRRSFNVARTGTGYATNHAACIFWALFFEAWSIRRGPTRATHILRDAALMAGIAAAVDYGATPKRFTPGWELVLSRTGMTIAYGGLALGLAAGAWKTQSQRQEQVACRTSSRPRCAPQASAGEPCLAGSRRG